MLLPSFIIFLEQGYFNILFAAISLFIILLPPLCGYNDKVLNASSVNVAIVSPQAQLSYCVLLVSTLPSIIDSALDYSNFFDSIKWKKYIFGRVPIVITGFLVSVQFFVISDAPSIFNLTSSRAVSYLFALSSFKLVLTGSMMIILTSIKPTVFTGRATSLFSLFLCFIVIIKTYLPGSSASFYEFSAILNYIFLVIVVITLLYWLVKLAACTKVMTVSEYICLLYLLIYYVSLFGSDVNVFIAWSDGEHVVDFTTITAQELAIMNYCFSFAFIMISIAPGRIARFEAVTHLVCACLYSTYLFAPLMHSPYLFVWYIFSTMLLIRRKHM